MGKDSEIEKEIKHIQKDKKVTEIVKNKFIEEMKNGLGDEIKSSLEAGKPKKDNAFIRFFKNIFK
jgi:hypothetical protein